MRITLLSLLFTVLFVTTKAQPPANYYSTATGKIGAELKTALYNIIKGHTSLNYGDLWTAFKTTDQKANGKVWDMYSNCDYTFVTNPCSPPARRCARRAPLSRRWEGAT